MARCGWARAYRSLRHREGLGGGDPKLLAAIGAWLGWQALPFVMLAASLLGPLLVLITAARGPHRLADDRAAAGTLIAMAVLPGWLAAQALNIG